MRPRERRDTGQSDLLRSRLDAIINMGHPLVKLATTIDWSFLEQRLGAVYEDKPGRPPLPTRLMAGLSILKHTYDLSDEVLCERWMENPYYQFFCGEEFFQHRLVFDRSSLTRWRQRMGEERLQALLQESLSVAAKTDAIKPSDLSRIIVDTTVQPKNIMFPTDARLLNRAREILVRLANRSAIKLRQSYARVGKFALIKHQRYAHAKQFKRANRALKLKTYLGRIIRDIGRKLGVVGSCWSACWRSPDGCSSRSSTSAFRRSIRCTRQRWNALARARRIGLTSSASRSPSPRRYRTPRAVSSLPM
jgi:transposase, IS5 family